MAGGAAISLIPVIPAADTRRIVACAALLRSPQDGEALGAARALERLLLPHGLHVDALVAAALHRPNGADNVRQCQHRPQHQAAALWCLEAHYWSEREGDFLLSITRLHRISPKQTEWLERLSERRGRGE